MSVFSYCCVGDPFVILWLMQFSLATLSEYWQAAINDRRLAISVLLLVCLLLLVSVGRSIDLFIPKPVDSSAAYQPPEKAVAVNPAEIARWHLMGEADVSSLPTTTLALKLTGIFTGADGQQATAIIKVGDDPERVYHLGDQVSAGVVIVKILPMSIILKANGDMQQLPLQQQQLQFLPAPKRLGAVKG